MTNEIYKAEFKRIEENGLFTLEMYLKSSRVGLKGSLNRAEKKEVFEAYQYNKMIKDLYEYRNHNLFNQNKNSGLSRNGMIAYNAICQYRDEVMLIDA
jgi:hypothetical protein